MRRKSVNPAVAAAVILILSVGIGFLFDFICTQIEYKRYPRKYAEQVEKYAAEYDIPEEIVYSVILTESAFDSTAVSSAGAVGLMQMTPETFQWIAEDMLGESGDKGLLYDPDTNIRYGCWYLAYLYRMFGNWDCAFAAYNGGLGNVKKWLADSGCSDGNGNLKYIPITETREYVKKVNSAIKTYEKLYYDK